MVSCSSYAYLIGLVFKLADLFRQRKLRIETMASDTIDAPHGGTKLFLLNGVIESESPVDVSELNAAATDLANKMNMDVTINQIPS
jgi:glycine cleavage system regulatory protein